MKFQLSWLRQHVDAPGSPEEIGRRLTALGFALDGVEGAGDAAVLDLDIGSNRSDAMNHVGLARELAAALGVPLRLPPTFVKEAVETAASVARVGIEDLDLCPRYCARVVRGVKVGPSPAWMQVRLLACGIRPINVIVDVTNHVLLELGHPLHAFDLALLDGQRVIVRRAADRERMTTLDGQERELDRDMLVIADATRPVALAGVMGGANSEIRDETTDVLIESAVFAPAAVRRAARLVGLHTEASHRFERGCDRDMAPVAADRAAALLAEIAGGTVLAGRLDEGRPEPARRTATVRHARLRMLTGVDVPPKESSRILTALGFEILSSDGEALTAAIPTWRNDVGLEVDLVEEILRHHGFDRVPHALPSFRDGAKPRQPWERSVRRVREALAATGWLQAIHWTFDEPAAQRAWAFSAGDGAAGRFVELANPMAENLSVMRASLVPALLRSLAGAVRRGESDVRLFEEGPIFLARAGDGGPTPAEERLTLAVAATGNARPSHFLHAPRPVDALVVKGALLDALVAAGADAGALSIEPAGLPNLAPGAARILHEGRAIGWFGRVHPDALVALEVDAPVHAGEVSLDAIAQAGPRAQGYEAQSRFPKTVRDMCVLVDRNRSLGDILNVITAFRASEGAGDDLIESLELIDRYVGRGVPDDKVSLTFSLTYRRPDRTLVQDEVDARHQALLDALVRQAGATLRS